MKDKARHLILYFFLMFGAACLSNTVQAEKLVSYGHLAQTRVNMAWQEAHASLILLDENILPHEAKPIRKLLGSLREQVDLFAYAYPKDDHNDKWKKIRKRLDHGYEVIGVFKDLFDRQLIEDPAAASYKEGELKEKRTAVLNWLQDWRLRSQDYEAYLSEPSFDRIYRRDEDDLSDFYWGASDLKPQLELSGLVNLALLSKDLLKVARDDWRDVNDIGNPANNHNDIEKFHDFRKRLRSVTRVIRSTDGIYDGSEQDLVILETLVEKYGSINDKIITLEKLRDEDRNERAQDLEKEIGNQWEELVAEQRRLDIKDLLKRVRDSLI